jgi:3',5'-cyclic AMP phosphodiesterase CpdA
MVPSAEDANTPSPVSDTGGRWRVLVVSDIHYASPEEQARGGYEEQIVPPGLLRTLTRWYRHYIWLRDPLAQNPLLDRFLDQAGDADWVVANGDFSCDSHFIGVADDAAHRSVALCLDRLRTRHPGRTAAVFGDHELGKFSLFGGQGGLRLESWDRACGDLGIEPFWRIDLGPWVLVGVVSSLVALPVFEPETLEAERPAWHRLRDDHLERIRDLFRHLQPDRRVVLFCHDPSALPFLWREGVVRSRAGQIDATLIGHLHTPLVFRLSRLLAGMPPITFLGNTARRLSTALNQARCWRPFRVQLCPSLAGSELLKDGGYLTLDLNTAGSPPFRLTRHRLPR